MPDPFQLPKGFMTVNEMKFYLYKSKAKIDWLYEQVQQNKTKIKSKWKLDWKIISFEREIENETETNDEDKLQIVLSELQAQQLIGAYEEGKPYIQGIFQMPWDIYNDSGIRPVNEGPLVYFSGVDDKILLGLGGSSHHSGMLWSYKHKLSLCNPCSGSILAFWPGEREASRVVFRRQRRRCIRGHGPCQSLLKRAGAKFRNRCLGPLS
jgi:hypothetical protein